MNICTQLVNILASVFQVSTDIQMDVASGSMIIITAKRFIKKHKLLSLNAMKELVLAGTAEYLKILRIQPFIFSVHVWNFLDFANIAKSNCSIFFLL